MRTKNAKSIGTADKGLLSSEDPTLTFLIL